MTKCKLVQCIWSRKPKDTITTTNTGGTHSKPDHGCYFYFSSMYVARVLCGAGDEKSSRRPGTAVDGIHDVVEVQGCAETVRAAKAPFLPSGFRRVGRREGEASPGSLAIEKKDYESSVVEFWCSRMMPVRATILIPLCGPNPTAPTPSLFPIRSSGDMH